MREEASNSINQYVSEIRRELYGMWWTRRKIAAEFDTHLQDSVEALVLAGTQRDEAERRALQRFGSPRVVAQSLAHSRGVGVATEFTRLGGLAAAVGAIAVAASDIGQEFSEPFRNGAYSEISLPARLLLVVGALAMYRRVRGNLGVWGRRGFQLVVAGTVIGFASSMAWFEPGGWAGLAMVAGGLGSYLVGVLRADVLPASAVKLLILTTAATFCIGLGGTLLKSDTGLVAQLVGSVGLALAMTWIGVSLYGEHGGSDLSPPVGAMDKGTIAAHL